MEQDNIIEILKQIKKIKPFAETTKFFDFILDYSENYGLFFGIKKNWQDISEKVAQYGLFEAKNDCIIRKGNGAVSDFAIKMKDETTAKDFENRLRGMSNNEGFIDFFKTIEENAQIRVKEATETLKELLGKDVTKV